jgi:hypothetical protein
VAPFPSFWFPSLPHSSLAFNLAFMALDYLSAPFSLHFTASRKSFIPKVMTRLLAVNWSL